MLPLNEIKSMDDVPADIVEVTRKQLHEAFTPEELEKITLACSIKMVVDTLPREVLPPGSIVALPGAEIQYCFRKFFELLDEQLKELNEIYNRFQDFRAQTRELYEATREAQNATKN